MTCPRCGAVLQPRTRVGAVVDVCERCAGIWMDRTEALKIATELHALQRAVGTAATAAPLEREPLLRLRRRLGVWNRLLEVFVLPAQRG